MLNVCDFFEKYILYLTNTIFLILTHIQRVLLKAHSRKGVSLLEFPKKMFGIFLPVGLYFRAISISYFFD